MSKRSNKCEFSPKARREIYERDSRFCIFCRMAYMPSPYQGTNLGVAHYISRAHGGLGIPQNGVLACQYHHNMMDNGNNDKRDEMLAMVREYLQAIYHEWDEKSLVYSKWG